MKKNWKQKKKQQFPLFHAAKYSYNVDSYETIVVRV